MARKLRILSTAYDYRPSLGGVATCTYEVLSALSRIPGVDLRLIAREMPGAEEFDRQVSFQTRRVELPEVAAMAVAPTAARIGAEMLRWRPHAVLNFLWLPGGLASALVGPARWAVGTRLFVVAHGVELMETSRNFRKRVRGFLSPVKKAVFAQASAVFPVSRFTANLLKKDCGVSPDRIRIIYNGVDTRRFAPAGRSADLMERHGLIGKRVFLTVTRLEDYKGVDRAIAALRHVVREHPDVVYVICGEGKDRPRLEALARHYRVDSHVVFAGAVPGERLQDYYNLCDCFVLLSREDWEGPEVEGFGIVFLEAAACGKPAIAGASGGIPDAVEDGQGGWLVDPWDDRSVAQAMLEALRNPAELERRGRAARERVLGRFTWDHVAFRVYEEMLKHVRD